MTGTIRHHQQSRTTLGNRDVDLEFIAIYPPIGEVAAIFRTAGGNDRHRLYFQIPFAGLLPTVPKTTKITKHPGTDIAVHDVVT